MTNNGKKYFKFDCCFGPYSSKYRIWHLLKGTNNTFFCEYCVENGCINKTNITRYTGQLEVSGCSCSKKHPHVVDLVCPTCQVKIILKIPIFFCHKCYICTYPLKDKRNTLCTTCSFISKHCARCKNEIRSGDDYIDDLYAILEKIKLHDAHKDEEHIKQHMHYIINCLGEQIEKISCEFDGKTNEQMKDLLIEKARKECEHCN